MFENNTVEIDHIPQYQEIEFSNLNNNYKKIVVLNSLITLLLGVGICAVLFFLIDEMEKLYVIIPLFLISVLLAVFPLLSYKKKEIRFSQTRCTF